MAVESALSHRSLLDHSNVWEFEIQVAVGLKTFSRPEMFRLPDANISLAFSRRSQRSPARRSDSFRRTDLPAQLYSGDLGNECRASS